MTENDDAVQITADAVNRYTHRPGKAADDVVAALARAGLLARPGELAALRALYAAVKSPDRAIYVDELDALDAALPAGYVASREPENWQQRCENCGDIFEHVPGVPTLYCPTCAALDAAPAASRIVGALADALDEPGTRYYAATGRDLVRVLHPKAAAALLAAARRELTPETPAGEA